MFNANKTKLTKLGNRNDISKEFVEFKGPVAPSTQQNQLKKLHKQSAYIQHFENCCVTREIFPFLCSSLPTAFKHKQTCYQKAVTYQYGVLYQGHLYPKVILHYKLYSKLFVWYTKNVLIYIKSYST